MKRALIIIDIQNDYFKGGKNELYCPEEALEQAKLALEFFRSRGMPVYHVQHISLNQNAAFFLPGSIGAEIHESVKPHEGERVFVKHFPNAFLKTGLSDELLGQDISQLVICGMMSHMCIDTTVRAAQDHGFAVTLLEDACTTRELKWGGSSLSAVTVHNTIMASLNGVFAQVVRTAEFIESAG